MVEFYRWLNLTERNIQFYRLIVRKIEFYRFIVCCRYYPHFQSYLHLVLPGSRKSFGGEMGNCCGILRRHGRRSGEPVGWRKLQRCRISGQMAPPPFFSLNHPKLSANVKAIFNVSYSTSILFPPNLKHLFSKPSKITAAGPIPNETIAQSLTANRNNSKKARTTAELINTNPWSAHLEARLSTLTPLSRTTFFQTLRRIKTPSKALRFFKWAQQSGFTHSQQSYFIMLEILGRARHLNPARNFLFSIPKNSSNAVTLTDKLFNSLIRSYGDAGLFQESLKVFEAMKSMGVSPSTVTFNSLFLILFKKGRVGMVYELFDEMLKTYGAKPDLYTFNVLIRGFCMNSKVDEAFRMFREMEKFECEPDLITYNTIVDGLCRAGKVNIARNVVNGMQRKCENLRPNLVTYTTLIRGYCGKQEIKEALEVFREMVGSGITPSQITCNTLIQGLCESHKLDTMKEIIGECQRASDGFVPDTCTFNTIMSAHCSQGNSDEALKVFEKMKELNVERDSATYSILTRSLCNQGNFEKAEELLDEVFQKEILLRDDNCTPIAASYNPIFKHLCANGKTKKAERVLRQLMKMGKQDPLAFETLILGHCEEGTFGDGYKLLVLMLRRDFIPNNKIYESLIEGLLKNKEANLAHDTLERMLRSSYMPRTSMFHRVLMELIAEGSAHESANLMTLMLDNEIRPNINLSTDVVRVLYKSSMKERAFQLVKSLYEKGYVVNMELLIHFLCENGKLLEASELVVFSLKNDQGIDIAVCNTVLTGLSLARKVSEAFHLYYELLEKGLEIPLSLIEDLKKVLEGQGRTKEAEFVGKRMMNL